VLEFYAALEGPVVVGIEATGAMQWFLELLEELGIGCRVGHPAKIRAAETRKQKHDRRDARLILDMLTRKDGFPEIWMPSIEQRDLRTLLRDRHQWVKMRTRVQNTLQAIALNHALRRDRGLWTSTGQKALQALSLPSHTQSTVISISEKCSWPAQRLFDTSDSKGSFAVWERAHRHVVAAVSRDIADQPANPQPPKVFHVDAGRVNTVEEQ
jgi:hypothetical protein